MFFTHTLLFVPSLMLCPFCIFNMLSVENRFFSTARGNYLPILAASRHTQLSLTVQPGELHSYLGVPQVWTWNSEGLILKSFLLYFLIWNVHITDYISTVKLLKFHLYSKSFVEKAMVLPYSSEKTPYIRIIDVLPNIWETQSYLFFGDIFSGYT